MNLSLKGNVSIIGDEFDISCGKMKIIIDQNGTDKKTKDEFPP